MKLFTATQHLQQYEQVNNKLIYDKNCYIFRIDHLLSISQVLTKFSSHYRYISCTEHT